MSSYEEVSFKGFEKIHGEKVLDLILNTKSLSKWPTLFIVNCNAVTSLGTILKETNEEKTKCHFHATN